MIVQRFGLFLGPDDVISNVLNTNLYKCSHNPMIHLYIKLNADIFVCFCLS